jgi:hypothetical protein
MKINTNTNTKWTVTEKIIQTTKSSPPLRITQGIWARNSTEKAHAFANHLMQVFQPHPSEHAPDETNNSSKSQKTLTNSTHQPIASKELKSKQSSTAHILRNHQDTT